MLIVMMIFSLYSCKQNEEETNYQFERLSRESTGIDFVNKLVLTEELNVFTYMYFYNGGGVATADFNNDGQVDVFLTSNQEDEALYINNGQNAFQNVIDQSGIGEYSGWTNGVTVVDINNDGLMDIYLSQVGDFLNISGRNQLFICSGIDDNGIPHYSEKAGEYGLDLVGFGTQAAFFDYDLDGDLDMYQLNHSVHANGTFGQRKRFTTEPHPLSGDKLMRNDDGKFFDVAAAAGLFNNVIGYGLGLAISDINLDGYPDIYVSNDFQENDYLYLNQGDGTFKESLTEQIQHTSRFSMGVDIADINNDGHNEILTLDMLPYDPVILKSSLGEDGYSIFQFKLGFGYNHQYARNSLQLNNTNGTFSEVAMYMGIHATDWSWAPLLFDFNADGQKDIFISNGIPRRMNDIDYVNFMTDSDTKFKAQSYNLEKQDLVNTEKMPVIKLPNKFFLNDGKLGLKDIQSEILDDQSSFSNGAAFADFDNDGDLDIIVNNIDDAPFLYKNLTSENNEKHSHYLHLHLTGTAKNIRGIGSKLVVFKGEEKLITEYFPTRGFQSAMDDGIWSGVGDPAKIDSIILIWPDLTYQQLNDDQLDTLINIKWKPGLPTFDMITLQSQPVDLYNISDITETSGIDFQHSENPFVEFNREQLIPHMASTEGPALAVGDLNNDGREDLFLGNAKRRKNTLLFQNEKALFDESNPEVLRADSIHEDVDALMIDVNSDQALDLVIASGGNEFRGTHEAMKPLLYLNDGKGNLQRDAHAFENVNLVANCVFASDFNADGAIDLFFGARAETYNYGRSPRSYLLRNNGSGKFEDVTEFIAPDLSNAGMIHGGAWTDIDNDGDEDLILAAEWQPILIFLNTDGRFKKVELPQTNGWWNFICPADFDGDGDIDFVAGNLGLNGRLKASVDQPVRLYVNDFDQNGQVEQLLTSYVDDREWLFPNFTEVTKQMPNLKKKFLFAKDFATTDFKEYFDAEVFRSAQVLEAFVFENSYFENIGDVSFERHDLPQKLQFSSLRTAIAEDFNADGLPDLMIAGNFYENNIEMGRYDSDFGTIITNDGNGILDGHMQTLGIKGQVRKIRPITIGQTKAFIFARNNETPIILSISNKNNIELITPISIPQQ